MLEYIAAIAGLQVSKTTDLPAGYGLVGYLHTPAIYGKFKSNNLSLDKSRRIFVGYWVRFKVSIR